MSPHKKQDRRRTLRSLYVWHRWIGILCALLVLWLAVTGILLNHASRLGLDRPYTGSPWLLRAYGITPEPPTQGFAVAGRWLAQAGEQLFLNGRPVAELRGPLVGAAALPGVILAVAADEAVLLTDAGELIESLGPAALPGPVLAVASTELQFLLRTAKGLYASPAELPGFEPYVGRWPGPDNGSRPLPPEIAQAIAAAGAGIRLNGERVLADLHSGRLFGRYGPWVMDLASLGFIFLALSGLWLWWRYRQSQRDRSRHHPD